MFKVKNKNSRTTSLTSTTSSVSVADFEQANSSWVVFLKVKQLSKRDHKQSPRGVL